MKATKKGTKVEEAATGVSLEEAATGLRALFGYDDPDEKEGTKKEKTESSGNTFLDMYEGIHHMCSDISGDIWKVRSDLQKVMYELGYHELLLTELAARVKPFANKKEHNEWVRKVDKMMATHKRFAPRWMKEEDKKMADRARQLRKKKK